MVRLILINWWWFTGGPNGINNVPLPSFFGIPFHDPPEGHSLLQHPLRNCLLLQSPGGLSLLPDPWLGAVDFSKTNLTSRRQGFLKEGKVVGVKLKDGTELTARLTIAADGRTSIVRQRLPLDKLSAPIDILWFNVAKEKSKEGSLRFAIGGGAIIVLMDRDTYWQCAFVIPKGYAEKLMADGLIRIPLLFAPLHCARRKLRQWRPCCVLVYS